MIHHASTEAPSKTMSIRSNFSASAFSETVFLFTAAAFESLAEFCVVCCVWSIAVTLTLVSHPHVKSLLLIGFQATPFTISEWTTTSCLKESVEIQSETSHNFDQNDIFVFNLHSYKTRSSLPGFYEPQNSA